MPGRWGLLTTVIVAGSVALAACGGDDGDASADARRPDRVEDASASDRATTTTDAAADASTTIAPSTTTTVPPPYSFDGSVPPPPLNNTGDDFEAIARSLDSYAGWVKAHNPDPALVSAYAAQGSSQYTTQLDDVQELIANDARSYELDAVTTGVEILDRRATAVLLRLIYGAEQRVIVRSTGEIIDQAAVPAMPLLVLLTSDAAGRWRLASVTVDSEVGIEL